MGASGRLGGALAGRHLGGAGHADRWRHPAEIPDAYPIWERVQQEVAAEFGGAEVQELLIRLRRLTGGSERLAGIRTEMDH